MKHVIVMCYSEEEFTRLDALTDDNKSNYKVIRRYHRAEWNFGKIIKPYVSYCISCKTSEEEFLLRLKFNTISEKVCYAFTF